MKLKLNKKVYSKSGINSAIDAFEDLCNVKITLKDDYYLLSFDSVEKDVKDSILDEFSNFALYGTIAGKK